MKVFYYSLKGLRDQNEDAHKIVINGKGKNSNQAKINFFGIYDGHGGKEVSRFLENNMSNYFMSKKVKYPLSKSYINKVYDHLQNTLKNNHRFSSYSGSTSLVAINFKSNGNMYLNVINTGDSRAVVCQDTMAIPLTLDHKPNFPDERKRIEQMGGKIVRDGLDYRVKDLAVSRAFGDVEATPYVTHRSDLFKYKIDKKDKFIIMACDGLWDVMDNQEAVNFVLDNSYEDLEKFKNDKEIAKKLAEYAIKKGSTDNVSVIVLFF